MSQAAETELNVVQGGLQLRRFPRSGRDPLRAWDAADVYLLKQLDEEPLAEGVTYILNDACGALAVSLAGRPATAQPVFMSSDSWLAHQATCANLRDNGLSESTVSLLKSVDAPPADVATVLIKIPKSLALLEDQLHRLRPHLLSGARILGAGMVRDIHTSTLQLFEGILGPTTTSLARSKARLIHCELDPDLDPGASPYPTEFVLEGTDWTLSSDASVFSRDRLDIGTRHLLAQVPTRDGTRHIVDLACGNGVVGLVAAERNPLSRISFVDESFMALASAKRNWDRMFGTRTACFEAADCLGSMGADSADVILCNPPFHQHHAKGDATAWRMFTASRRVLRSGGELIIVGNRHLAYHAKLSRLFGDCEVLHSDAKFVVLQARCR